MKIIQIIKNFFNRIKVKKLDVPKEITQEELIKLKEKIAKEANEIIPKIEVKELTNGEKIKKILKNIGCKKEIFYLIEDFENMDMELLKNNIKQLNELKFSKYELSKIITQNPLILNTVNENICLSIKSLEEYLKDINIVKEVIFMNPYVLTNNIEKYIKETKEAFFEKGISVSKQVNIIEENSNILLLGKEKIKRSLDLLLKIVNDKNRFEKILELAPILIGCNEEVEMKKYIINEI